MQYFSRVKMETILLGLFTELITFFCKIMVKNCVHSFIILQNCF